MATKKKLPPAQAQALLAKVEGKSMEAVTTSLASVKVALTGMIDDVSNTTNTLLSELRETQIAIDYKKEELKELHGVEAELLSLESAKKADIEYRQMMDQAREEQMRLRAREEEEFNYERNKKRRAEDDAWELTKKLRTEQYHAEFALVKADIAARSIELDGIAEENEHLKAELAEEVAGNKAELDKAVAIATNSVKRDLEHKHALEKASAATELQLLQARVKSLEEALASAKVEIGTLNTRLSAANDKVQSIAEKAIDGASQQRVVVNQAPGEVGKR